MFWAALALAVISLAGALGAHLMVRRYEESNDEMVQFINDPISRLRLSEHGLELADNHDNDDQHRHVGTRSSQSVGQTTLAGFDRSSPEYKAAARCVREASGVKHCPSDEDQTGRARLRPRKRFGTA